MRWITNSEILSFNRCKKQHNLTYSENLICPAPKAQTGDLVHRTVEAELLDTSKPEGRSKKSDAIAEVALKKIAEVSELYSTEFTSEEEIRWKMNNEFGYRGKLDLVSHEARLILDMKVSRYGKSEADLIMSQQLRSYSSALWKYTGDIYTVGYISLPDKLSISIEDAEVLTFEYPPSQVESHAEWMEQMCDKIFTNECSDRSLEWTCRFCNFYELCQAELSDPWEAQLMRKHKFSVGDPDARYNEGE